jgi:Tol biopolymer transport system component
MGGLIIGTIAFLASSGLASAQTAAPSTATLRANGKIAFSSDRDGNREIYVMNGDGTNQVRLTNNSVVDDHPTWSPDGMKIAFVSEKASGGFAIFVMNADGTNKVEITPIVFNATAYPVWDAWGMSWSPDGARIVFQEKVEPSGYPAYPNDIFIVNIASGNRQILVDDPVDARQPSWSPDGSRILFASQRDSAPFYHHLFTVRPDGSDLQRLASFNGESDLAPTWSPTGEKIAFQIFDYANFESIGVANADGSDRYWFDDGSPTENYGGRDKPNWSPDGSKIVFHVAGPPERGTQIYVKNVDGTGLTCLTNLPGNNFKPSWQPLAQATCPNPIDCAEFFVRQHYRDFLNREPDAPGLAHWAREITACDDPSWRQPGESLAQCTDRQRTNTSAAFFLSPEFQYTGYFVYRLYKGSLLENAQNVAGRPPTYQEFLRDVQLVASGIIKNNQLSASTIEQNKKTFAEEFTRRAEFRSLYDPLSNFDYVERLFQTTGISVSEQEKQALVDGLNSQTETRASVLQKVVDGVVVIAEGNQQFTTGYGRAFYEKEFNAAFVLMEYFGYLQRDPDAAGYQHWLDKLNFYGNYIDAEMVRSFILSPEYRARFGQP